MAPKPGESASADTAAVSLVDGRSDSYSKEIRQASGAAGIYGMTFAQNSEISKLFPGFWNCRIDVVPTVAYAHGKLSWQTAYCPDLLYKKALKMPPAKSHNPQPEN